MNGKMEKTKPADDTDAEGREMYLRQITDGWRFPVPVSSIGSLVFEWVTPEVSLPCVPCAAYS
jgi:hypothetical protein